MSDIIEQVADEISGHPIGSGYYQTTVGIHEAREIAQALADAGPAGYRGGDGDLLNVGQRCAAGQGQPPRHAVGGSPR